MFKPLLCNSLYNATTFGFSALHGPHQDAQKSIIVAFPKDSFKETVFPSGVFAEKSGALVELVTFFFLELKPQLKFLIVGLKAF